MVDTSDAERHLRDVAAALSLELPDGEFDDSLADIAALKEKFYRIDSEADGRNSVGSFSDDEYNALLDVYDRPRVETDDGPLSGLTVAVKDNIAVRDLRLTCGARGLRFVPSYDAAVVERLLAAGAGVAGKANMDAFAFGPNGTHSEFGPVVNPVDRDRVPGGSSSGSGAAVAGGLVDAALGTETGGSVRKPAACCGVVGLKPSRRLLPRHGLADFTPSVHTIGVLSGDVATAARLLEAMAGRDHRDPSSARVEFAVPDLDDSTDLAVGVPESMMTPASDPVRAAVEELVSAVGDAGADVRPVELDASGIAEAYPFLVVGEFAAVVENGGAPPTQGTGATQEWRAAFAEFIAENRFNEHIADRVAGAAALNRAHDGRPYAAARRVVAAFRERLDRCFEEVDLLLGPTIPVLPPRVDERDATVDLSVNMKPFSLAGTPAVTVPVAEHENLPVSAQVIAPTYRDDVALRGARLLETVSGKR